ncbi:hypothetical protein [uncultured Roseibium sp.]|uniref:hypothetical protein n=1 Tax=uncultured Roseibium sp. TaxID=1936171 RepID=UPI00260B03F0|nr:hypothetical protein [uncultured Roseibium sp.]
MMRQISEYVQFFWMFESHAQQRLAWEDAAEARIARIKAEEAAALQLQAMLDANPSGSLGHSKLNDIEALKKEGLL